jgi:hypothetical protein
MTTTVKMRKLWAHYRCIHASNEPKTQAHLWGTDRGPTPTACVDAWAVLETTLLESGYRIPKSVSFQRLCPEGIDGKPCQESGADCSLHNYGLAVDIDPFKHGNRHFKKRFGDTWDFSDTRITRPQVEAVESIRTNSGARVFRWLGWTIGDTMHFQFDCSPSDLITGFTGRSEVGATVISTITEEQMTPTQVRLEIAAAWHSRTGMWMSRNDDESAQQRLTRLAQEVVDGKRTAEDIVKVAGLSLLERPEPISPVLAQIVFDSGEMNGHGPTGPVRVAGAYRIDDVLVLAHGQRSIPRETDRSLTNLMCEADEAGTKTQ